MEAIGLGGDENAGRRLTVLRAIDKIDRLGAKGVLELLTTGRTDESGDKTDGAGLDREQAMKIVDFCVGGVGGGERSLFESNNSSRIARLRHVFPGTRSYQSGLDELEDLSAFALTAGFEADVVGIDPSVVRGLEYYTGPVFEAQLTFEVPNEKGQPVVFGSVGGGGRYDGLVGRFRGEDVPATGFSVGVSRHASALKAIGKLGDESFSGPVVVTVMDRGRMAQYQQMVAELRNAGIAAEMYLGESGMKAQLKYADRRHAAAAIIAGSNEFDSGKLQVKDLAAGKAEAASIGGHDAWRDERPGQYEILREELVPRIKQLLSKQRRG
jgi:histidyl-tRNA synthetase